MLDIQSIRRQFPALQELFEGRPAIFFDNPGGTQVPQRVIDAITDYYIRRNANTHGEFITSHRSDAMIERARQAAADLLGADRDEVIFGNNMTSLTFALSHTLAHELKAGDEIIVTRLDHDANVSPWLRLTEDTGATIRWADVDIETCTLDMVHMRSLISPKTKLVAVGYASNATGTINDVKQIIEWAKTAGALTFIDAVQYAPHGLIDVKALDCDFLACSAYKFFGPHVGILYGKRQHLDRLRAYRVRPAGDKAPDKWETGTKNHEGLAGTLAAIDYLADLGATYGGATIHDSRRARLKAMWPIVSAYEQMLAQHLINGLRNLPGVRIYGLTDQNMLDKRVATVAIRKEGIAPQALAQALAAQNIFATHGNFYAVAISERLGVEQSGGVLRLGLTHYNTVEEIDLCLRVLERVRVGNSVV
ncbi:MAG TPA: cysteine desulfurase-like protein [Caldilineaceae bacterium]|nr:cysteine desulfurase-like protein [Caldilineaceae bacterium]